MESPKCLPDLMHVVSLDFTTEILCSWNIRMTIPACMKDSCASTEELRNKKGKQTEHAPAVRLVDSGRVFWGPTPTLSVHSYRWRSTCTCKPYVKAKLRSAYAL